MTTSVRKWAIDWDAAAALIDFAKLEDGEIAVAIQIINLMYAQNGDIDNSPEDIKNYIKKMGKKRCQKLIHSLIHKGVFFEENGRLFHKKVRENLKKREESFQSFRKFGQKGAEMKKQNQQNQSENPSPPTESLPLIPLSNTSNKTSIPLTSARAVGMGSFSIWDRLTIEGESAARSAACGWDIRKLAEKFDAKVASGVFIPPNNPDEAFAKWCKVYTKGKRPQ